MYIEKPKAGGDFELVPAGTHLAVCYSVVDLGTQETNFGAKRQVQLAWELPDETIEIDGQARPMIIRKRYTFSMHDKATLREHLEAWRGREFVDDDFDGPNRFNIKKLLGVGCMLSVVHKARESDGKEGAYISSVSKLLKGTTTPPAQNPLTYFSMQFPADYEPEVFAAFPDWLRELIGKSPEHQEIMRLRGQVQSPQRDWRADMEGEEIPF